MYYHTYQDLSNTIGISNTADLYLRNRVLDYPVTIEQYEGFKKALKELSDKRSNISVADSDDLVWLKSQYQVCHQLGYIDAMAPLMKESLFGRAYLSAAKKYSDGIHNDYSHCSIPSAKEIFTAFKLVVKRHTQKYGAINGISKYAKYLEN